MRNVQEVLDLDLPTTLLISDPTDASPAHSAFELLPRTKWSLKAKVRWYVSLRYWKQAVAVATIYTGVLSAWVYLVR
jgi:hypothetical protein